MNRSFFTKGLSHSALRHNNLDTMHNSLNKRHCSYLEEEKNIHKVKSSPNNKLDA